MRSRRARIPTRRVGLTCALLLLAFGAEKDGSPIDGSAAERFVLSRSIVRLSGFPA